jgi:branched-chain amino acid transport system ATP-binding protein
VLTVRDLHAWYGSRHVLRGASFDVRPGEITALLGRNGCGRSTTARALMGLVRAEGRVDWRGVPLLGLAPHRIARLGLGYVPESRDVFPRLTVRQNLLLGQKAGGGGRWTFDAVFALFPPLKARERVQAGALSGGEQQMLALGRALMGDPGLIVIDEPTEGLAPMMVERVAGCLLALRQQGMAVLLIEQKLAIALAVADRALVMGQGRIVFDGTPAGLRADAAVRQEWLEA